MSRSLVETVLGAVVLLGAFVFLVYSYGKGDIAEVSGYPVYAEFSGIGGLKVGDSVEISGVKIGQVSDVSLDHTKFLAKVTMEIEDSIKLPDDTAALISSVSMLGGRYLSLEPGSSEEMIPKGGRVEFTQAPQNLEELLGKFIFSMNKGKDEPKDDTPKDNTNDAAETKAVTAPADKSTTESPVAP